MNPKETIRQWRNEPVLKARTPKGWDVEFAKGSDGTTQPLDYAEGTADTCDPSFPMSDKHVGRLAGLIEQYRVDGPQALRGTEPYDEFIGDDAKDGMCEFRIKRERGHRFLCFKRGERRLLIAFAFRKPAQMETPHEHKTAARQVLHAQPKTTPQPANAPHREKRKNRRKGRKRRR